MLQDLKEASGVPVAFLLLVVVFGEMCGGMGLTYDGVEMSESSALSARLDNMERLLH